MFALEKLKNKVNRRASESSILELATTRSSDRRHSFSNPMITVSESHEEKLSPRFGSQSRSRSRSMSVRHTSPFGSRGSSPAKGLSTKELIKHETAHVISNKLLSVLKELGLQDPIPMKTTHGTSANSSTSKTTKIFVANSNNCIFLAPASSASFTYEDVENGNQMENVDLNELLEAEPVFSDEEVDPLDTAHEESPLDPHIPPTLSNKIAKFSSPNYLCTRIDSETPIPHTFAVIIELSKDTRGVRDLKFEFMSSVSTLWPTSDPYNKAHLRERFNIGEMEWNTSLGEADLYINSHNSNDVRMKKITADEMARRTRAYRLVNIRDLAEEKDKDKSEEKPHLTTDDEVFKAGLYVFLLPVLLPEHIPASIVSINGSLSHTLHVSFSKSSDKLNRRAKVNGQFQLPLVRTPPSFANSVADKPIYVNRVWNDSLHYIITFPRKYVALGGEHVINVKLVPLVKDVVVKRIRFNVLERITYVSRNLKKEYDYDGEDPFHFKHGHDDGKVKERIVSLCELKTKQKPTTNAIGSEPYKEEVIKCPDNNLLCICYEEERRSASTTVVSPLEINVALPFLTTKSDKNMVDDEVEMVSPSSRKASVGSVASGSFASVIGSLETNLSHQSGDGRRPSITEVLTPESSMFLGEDHPGPSPTRTMQRGYTKSSKALYPDSNFRHIQIHHRLQVCFRISKPDPRDNYKMHHYEVVVDTPLVLVSAMCSEGSIQLPEYDELYAAGSINEPPVASPTPTETPTRPVAFRTPTFSNNGTTISAYDPSSPDPLPSFEEAMSASSSPVMRSFSVSDDTISRIPSISSVSRDPAPSYDSLDAETEDGNVDDVLHALPRRQSVLRSSLASSFAPRPKLDHDLEEPRRSPSFGSRESVDESPFSEGEDEPREPSMQEVATGEAPFGMPSPESNSVPLSCPTEPEDLVPPFQPHPEDSPRNSMGSSESSVPPPSMSATVASGDYEEEAFSDSSVELDVRASQISLAEEAFSQRLPLLRFTSQETVPRKGRERTEMERSVDSLYSAKQLYRT